MSGAILQFKNKAYYVKYFRINIFFMKYRKGRI